MSLSQFLSPTEPADYSLVVVNRDAPRPVQTMLEGLFEDQAVTVTEDRLPDVDDDVVHLVEDGTVVASSPLAALQDAILLINSDLFITGSRGIDAVELPDVIESLAGVGFSLRGYPESNKEKLLLIVISRYIERLSLESDGGKHRASFQRLSRISDERGTRTVYERLAASDVDAHVYGVPNWTPPPDFDLTIHGGWSADFTDSWFVTHHPDDASAPHAALIAIETEPRVWDGIWTFDPARVREINRYIEREL